MPIAIILGFAALLHYAATTLFWQRAFKTKQLSPFGLLGCAALVFGVGYSAWFAVTLSSSGITFLDVAISIISLLSSGLAVAGLVTIRATPVKEAAYAIDYRSFSQFFENPQAGIAIIEDDAIVYASERLCSIIGCAPGEISISDLSALLSPASEATPIVEQWIVTRGGERRYVRSSRSPIVDTSGKAGELIVAADITEIKQTVDELKKSEAKYRSLFEGSADAIFIETFDEQILECNQAACQMYGYTRDELLNLTVSDLIVESHHSAKERIAGQLKVDESIFTESRGVRKAGSEFPLEVSIMVRTIDGEPRIVAYVRDISLRKETERMLERHAAHLRTLREIDRGIIVARSPEEIAQAALRRIFSLIPSSRAIVQIFSENTSLLTPLAVQTAAKGKKRTEIPPIELDQKTIDRLNTGKIIIVDDIDALPEAEQAGTVFCGKGARACASAPLLYQGNLIGVLSVGADQPESFLPEHHDLIQDLANQLAVTIQQARLRTKAERSAAELEELRQVTLNITGELDLDSLLRSITESALRLLDADVGGIYFYNPGEDKLERVVSLGEPELLGVKRERGEGLSGKAWETGEPMMVDDYLAWEGAAKHGIGRSPRSVMAAPIHWADEFLGVVNAARQDEGAAPFTSHELRLLTLFADQAAVAIHNARLHKLTQERAMRLELVSQIGRRATAILDLDDLLQEVVRLMSRTFGYTSAGILLVEGDEVVVRASIHQGQDSVFNGLKARVGKEGITGWVAGAGEPLLVADVSKDERYIPGYEGEIHTQSELAVPIMLRDIVIGVFDVQSDAVNAFTEMDVHTVQTIADQLAVAIQNATLYHQLEQYSEQLEQAVAERTAELETANRELTALSQVKDEFVSNVSHELRTPITNLKLHHQLMSMNPGKSKQYLETLNRETLRLEHIIEGLLFLSRLDQNRLIFSPKHADLNELARQYVEDRRSLAEERGLTMEFTPSDELKQVRADPSMIGEALSVLLTNALNYTPEGGLVEVATRVRHEEDRVWSGISVIDTGPGIPPLEMPHLFERFFRGSAAYSSGAPGTGLGLSIACEIVEQHRGKIEIRSDGIPGKGAEFTIWLPANGNHKD